MGLSRSQIFDRIHHAPAYILAVRIIGYEGVEPFTFFDAAKKAIRQADREKPGQTELTLQKVQNAMFDLTRADRREASPPRYELNGEARDLSWQLLFGKPGTPDYKPDRQQKFIEELMALEPEPQVEVAEAQPTKKKRRGKGR